MSTDNNKNDGGSRDIERYPHLKQFLRFIAERMGSAKNTIETYEREIKNFYEWMIASKGTSDIRLITKKDLFAFRDFCEQQGYAHGSIHVRFAALKNMIGYLIQNEVIPEAKDPWPTRLHLKGERSLPHTVPSPAEIFRIRLRPRVRLEWAWHFEVTLSTGMRSDETAQLRAADFDFNTRPIDKELGYTSPYFAGSINLARNNYTTKNGMPRRVYFSQLAAKLTREMFAKYNITSDDAIAPLHVGCRTAAQAWMNELGKGIIESNASISPASIEPQRDRYFLDVNADMLHTSEYFKKMLTSRQDAARNIEEYKLQAAQPPKVRDRKLHPHALRHAFTSFMYYRNPMGERNAADSLRILLGHVGYSQLITYLRSLALIDNDATWQRLWLGKPQDWSGINR